MLFPYTVLEFSQFLLDLCVVFTGHNVGFTVLTHSYSSFLSYYSIHKEIICLVVRGCEHAFKDFERIWYTRETTMIIISRIIPNVWSALGSLDPQNPNHNQISQMKTPFKESLF